PRRDAARHRRAGDLPRPARGGGLDPGPHAHRQGRDRRPRRRAGRRRRRLRRQAVLVHRAHRAPARADPPPPGRATGRPRGRRPAPRPRRPPRVARRDRGVAVAHRVRPAGDAHALARPRAVAPGPHRARLGRGVREPLQRRGRLHPLSAQQDRPAVRRRVDRDGPRLRLPDEGRAGVRRVSIRARLTLVVAASLAVVLAAVGGFVYARVSTELEGPIRTELDEHSGGLVRMLARGEPLEGRGPPGTQILAADGHALNVAADTPREPLLTPEQVRRVLRVRRIESLTVAGRRADAVAQRYRGRPVVAVASFSLAQREHALDRLATELILGSLAGLLAGTLVAYLIARRAFEPFETMRRQAAAISATEPGGRLAVPRSDDELARLAETLNDMLDRLERALAHERRFVAEASHELRTPLAVLRAELELARSRPRSREELAEALDSVAEETDRLTRLADDLLVLARADGSATIHLATIDVAELLETVATRFEARAHEEHRVIEASAPA